MTSVGAEDRVPKRLLVSELRHRGLAFPVPEPGDPILPVVGRPRSVGGEEMRSIRTKSDKAKPSCL